MSVLSINLNNFNEVVNSGKTVLLDFYADWCGPCRMVSPIVHEIADERKDIIVGKVNVDEQEDLAQKFRVFSIPTLVVVSDGEVIEQAVGYRSKEQILSMLEG